jgi:hypothetical protein
MSAPRPQRRKGAPWKHRPHHRAFLALAPAARELAINAFRANETNAAIVDALLAQHGATIAESSLNRYREWWNATEKPALEAAERADELMRSFKEHPTPELERLIQQLLQAQRLTAMTEDKQLDPVKLGQLHLEERRLQLDERRVRVREQQLELKVRELAGRVEKKLRDAQASGRRLDDQTIESIRTDVYGLAPRASAPAAAAS